ncbi:unnamed protein product [Bursaphelenchus xylophilus]|uniref:(pine wood nematode) hypothetical protein n=1 Tax=Bursaphelenchus xylophilus TaxID=6326 RepID=A0A1I7RS99_BURXY|nr:unnamed protein product [Bursaphelenchus xylophilus]CAG9123098.1 unnamed protein product [Bursaphelenchus xylophilus]
MTSSWLSRLTLLIGCVVAQQAPCPPGWTYKSHTNQCYLLSSINLPYNEAVEYCKKDGGSLVSLKTQDEYDYVRELYNNNTKGFYPPWIGLKRDSRWYSPVWRWSDGFVAYFTKWLKEEPTKTADNACVAWRTIENHGWKTLGCKYAQRFICKQASANCPTRNYERPEGVLSSPNFPTNYPNNLNCFYHIKVKPGYRIKLEFHDFYTENYFDKVVLYDDYNGNLTNKIDTIYGTYLFKKIYESSENVLTLNFITDHIITRQGWNATYTSVHKEPTQELHDPTGTITSPNYPKNYPNDIDQLYLISTLPDKVLNITITDFNLEKNYDYLAIQDGKDIIKSKQLTRLTGTDVKTPLSFLTSQNYALVRFFTDPSLNYRGFSLNYEAVEKY